MEHARRVALRTKIHSRKYASVDAKKKTRSYNGAGRSDATGRSRRSEGVNERVYGIVMRDLL